jgi:energy-coupling factor transporter ATP-binding protein EcfA2
VTQIGPADGYELAQVADLPDGELMSLLRKCWGYLASHPLDVIGRLKEIPAGKSGSFFVLESLHSIYDGGALFYPLQEEDVKHTVFVGNVSYVTPESGSLDGKWVLARLELSPRLEREKHSNPFALKAVYGGVELLTALPAEALQSDFVIDGKPHVEQWVIDVLRQEHTGEVRREAESLREKLAEEHAEIVAKLESSRSELEERISTDESHFRRLSDDVEALNELHAQRSASLQDIEKEISTLQESHRVEMKRVEAEKANMESQLNILNQFIEEKSRILIDLDLIDQSDVDALLGKGGSLGEAEGHDFQGVFGAEPVRAVNYIQSFLHKKGTYYRRDVLQDFFALITTHDLIILAGDSGSGKTNLIKSFAAAIGGKAVIVPVKPNWTSAEDLLGYYNPLEQKYLSTPFLEALLEATRNPEIPYLICLDEMNLARVEYYLADFLSLLEERDQAPEIPLYSIAEADHLVSEVRNFLALIDEARAKLAKPDLVSFLDLLRDEELNVRLHELCGFREGDSLLRYHAALRRVISSYLTVPPSIRLPDNVRIIGTINVDETTHYLSPKVLDRAHIMRFGSPLLMDWEKAESEVEGFDIDLSLPVSISTALLGKRTGYPAFDRDDPLTQSLVHISREYLEPLGIEFGLRTVRQAKQYSDALSPFDASEQMVLNNIVMHKILPKLSFDGEKPIDGNIAKKDILIALRDHLKESLGSLDLENETSLCTHEIDRVIKNAQANDWVVNYWSR